MSLRDYLDVKLDRAYLTNLDSDNQETKTFLINPAELEESYPTNWVRHSSPGLSHEPLQYMGSKNAQIPISAIFDQFTVNQEAPGLSLGTLAIRNQDVDIATEVEDWRMFLMSLNTPRVEMTIGSASPPPVLFVWPGLIEMRVRITDLRFRHMMFYSGRPRTRVFVADFTMEEDVPDGRRLTSLSVRVGGTTRLWAGGA